MSKARNGSYVSEERETLGSPLRRAVLAAICFLAGAAIMVIEISGNRLLAPLFGNSIYTWTALRGERAELFNALTATLSAVFAHVRVFGLAPTRPAKAQNVILMASDAPLERFVTHSSGDDAFTRHLRANSRTVTPEDILDIELLTDNKNRIEAINARQLLR